MRLGDSSALSVHFGVLRHRTRAELQNNRAQQQQLREERDFYFSKLELIEHASTNVATDKVMASLERVQKILIADEDEVQDALDDMYM